MIRITRAKSEALAYAKLLRYHTATRVKGRARLFKSPWMDFKRRILNTERRRDTVVYYPHERSQGPRARFRRVDTPGMRLTINDLRSSNYSAFTSLSTSLPRVPLYCLPDIKRRVYYNACTSDGGICEARAHVR